jgi:hypothetical protein
LTISLWIQPCTCTHYIANDSCTCEYSLKLTTGRTFDNKVRREVTKEDESWPNPNLPLENPNEKLKTTLETPYEPRAPFPERLKESPSVGKQGERYQEMMDIFKQVQINKPFLDTIRQIPPFAKFLKDLCTQKRKMRKRSPEKILLTEQLSSLIQHAVAPKIKDPGAPTISCIIGDHTIEKTFLDLGVGVNLLPYSVYVQLGRGELKPTIVVLQLAD